jgi:hypothetical protein
MLAAQHNKGSFFIQTCDENQIAACDLLDLAGQLAALQGET